MAEMIRIVCQSCGRRWDYQGPVSDYGREALETRACPACGCCTLATHEPPRPKGIRLTRLIEARIRA
ncbi:MAG TPA: hypothetical protein VGJ05_01600 [Fimbriiglobus sp.]